MQAPSNSTTNTNTYSKIDKRRRTTLSTSGNTQQRKNAFPLPVIFGSASFIFIILLLWTQSRNVSHLSQTLCNTNDGFSTMQQSLHSFMEPRSSLTNNNNQKYGGRSDADIYHDAWYIADTPDWDAHHRIYEDEHIQRLVQDHKQNGANAAYRPYQIHEKKHNRSSTLNQRDSANHPILTTLRTVESTTKGFFNPVCQYYRFPNVTLFPTISVVIPMQFERAGLLSLTVHSLLARTPPEILHQIIVVDDNGEEREEVDDEEEFEALMNLHPEKIMYIRNPKRLGCAGSRLKAIEAATGDVIVVIDSHIEMYSSTWAQHLLLPIIENPRTLSMQTLDVLDDLPGHKRNHGGATQNFGFVNERFLFSYEASRFDFIPGGKETPTKREPFEIPFAPGSLFAIRRDEFWRLGGYDRGLRVWGGENTELVMKVWRCGFDDPNKQPGRVVVVPCSRVGHVYRIHVKETGRWPPRVPKEVQNKYNLNHKGKWLLNGGRADMFTRLVERNNLRIFRVWLSPHSSYTRNYYRRAFGVNSTDVNKLPPEWANFIHQMENDTEIARQEETRDRNKCKSIDWFDQHVSFRLVGRHLPMHDSVVQKELSKVSCGQHKADNCGKCPQGNGETWCNGDCHWCANGSEKDSVFNVRKTTDRTSGKLIQTLLETSQCVRREHKCRAIPPDNVVVPQPKKQTKK